MAYFAYLLKDKKHSSQMQYYTPARLAMLCWSVSILLSFRACFHRINTSPPPPDRRLIAYNELTNAQRQMFWAILDYFSPTECDRLSAIADKLTEEDWKVLKKVFGSPEAHQDKQAQQEETAFVVIILKIILQDKYTAPRVKTIIRALEEENYNQDDVQELLVAVNKAHAPADPGPTTSQHTSYERCTEEEIDKKWNNKLKQAHLGSIESEGLKKLLNIFPNEKKTLLELLELSPYGSHFLQVLCKKDQEEQKHLLEGILKLANKDRSLAEKMIEKYDQLSSWNFVAIGMTIPTYVSQLKHFAEELDQAYQANPS